MKKNILVTGCNGQLGREIQKLEPFLPGIFFHFTDIKELDITSETQLDQFFNQHDINYIINCAAYTAVDKAETEKDLATLINVTAVELIAKTASKYGASIIQISTDYVFDGKSQKSYLESDLPNPKSFYGHTKLLSEDKVKQFATNAIIIRTSWLYSEYGHNFVKTMLRLGTERESLQVIDDQIGSPTYAADLAQTILQLILNHDNSGIEIYNYSNKGYCSWFEFAQTIMELKNIDCKIMPIKTKDYPTAANRPAYSLLDKSKITKKLEIAIPYWKDSLEKCLKNL